MTTVSECGGVPVSVSVWVCLACRSSSKVTCTKPPLHTHAHARRTPHYQRSMPEADWTSGRSSPNTATCSSRPTRRCRASHWTTFRTRLCWNWGQRGWAVVGMEVRMEGERRKSRSRAGDRVCEVSSSLWEGERKWRVFGYLREKKE